MPIKDALKVFIKILNSGRAKFMKDTPDLDSVISMRIFPIVGSNQQAVMRLTAEQHIPAKNHAFDVEPHCVIKNLRRDESSPPRLCRRFVAEKAGPTGFLAPCQIVKNREKWLQMRKI